MGQLCHALAHWGQQIDKGYLYLLTGDETGPHLSIGLTTSREYGQAAMQGLAEALRKTEEEIARVNRILH